MTDMPALTGTSHHFSVQWTPNQISWVIDNLDQHRMTFPINMAAPSFSMLASARMPGDSLTVQFENIVLSNPSEDEPDEPIDTGSLNSIEFLTVDQFWLEAGDTLELLISAKSPNGLNPDSVVVDLEETPRLSVTSNYTVKDEGREFLIAVTIKAGVGGTSEEVYYPYLQVQCDDLLGNRLTVGRMIKAHFSANTPSIPDGDGDGFNASVDCDDTDPSIHPGATEIKSDGVDQNCNGNNDEDTDGDSYTVDDGDCDDNDPAKFPNKTWYSDDDGDGQGRSEDSVESCNKPGANYVETGGDECDNDPAKLSKTRYCRDDDVDGHGDPDNDIDSCNDPGVGYVTNCDDPDDGNPLVP